VIININNLDKSLLLKIPLSIRLNLIDGILDTALLPIEIRYELRNIETQTVNAPFSDKKTIDLIPIFSVYTDFKTITLKNVAVAEYVKNFLQIDNGDYQFDPTFGTNIKELVHRLDTETAKTAINMELKGISETLSESFNVLIKILTSNIRLLDRATFFEYDINIELQVDDIRSSISFVKTLETYYLM
jgi:hypothetical protein